MKPVFVLLVLTALMTPLAFSSPVLSLSFQAHVTQIFNTGDIVSPIEVGDSVTFSLFADFATVDGLGTFSGVPNPQPPGRATAYYQSGPADGMSINVQTTSGSIVFSSVGSLPASAPLFTELWSNGLPCSPGPVCPAQEILFDAFNLTNTPANFPAIQGDFFDLELEFLDLAAPFNMLSGAGFPSDFNVGGITLAPSEAVDSVQR